MEETQDPPLTPQQFSAKIKAKYPEYKDVDDIVLAKKIIEKYPEYAKKVSFGEVKKKGSSKPTSQEAAGVSPTRTTTPGTSSDTEPPMGAQASGGLGGPFQSIDPFGGKGAVGAIISEQQKTATLPTKKAAPAVTKKVEPPKEEDYFTGGFGNFLRGVDEISPIGIGDFIDDMARSVSSGYRQGTLAEAADKLLLKGHKATPEQIQKFIDANKYAQQMKPSDEMQDYTKTYEEEGKGFWGVVKGIFKNPTVVPELITSSLVGMATNIDALLAGAATIGTGATIGATTGASAGTVVLPVVGTVGGAAAGAIAGAEASIPYAFGVASSVVEAGSTFGELLSEELEGKDMTKENVRAILEDPEKLNSIRNKAIARGVIIGTVDALTGKLASGVGAKIMTKSAAKSATGAVTKGAVVRATAAGAGVESVGGSLGEATARGAVGQEMDVSEIALEGISELPGGVRSTIQARLAKPSYRVNGEKVDANQVDQLINTMTPEQLAATDFKIKNDYTGKEFKIQDKIVTNSIKEEVKKANPDLNEPSLNAITQLEKELKGLEGNKTQTGKDKAAALRTQIKNIQENQIQEEAVVETAKAEGMSVKAPEKNVFYYYEAKGEKAPTEVPAGYTSMKRVENSEEVKLWKVQKPTEAKAAEVKPAEVKTEEAITNEKPVVTKTADEQKQEIEAEKQEELNGYSVQTRMIDAAFQANAREFKPKPYPSKEYDYPKEITHNGVVYKLGPTVNDHFTVTNTETGFQTKHTHAAIYNITDPKSTQFKDRQAELDKEIEKVETKYQEKIADLTILKNKPVEVKPTEVKPAIESPIELKEGEELVDVKQDENGNTLTYVAETSEKKGVKTTKFKFNRSDKSSDQRAGSGVDADKVLDKYGYEIDNDSVPSGVKVREILEIREGEKTTGATATFVDGEGNIIKAEIVLEPKAKEAKAEEVKTVTHNGIEYTKNNAGNWVNTKTGNEIKGIGEKGKDLIKTLDDLAKPAEVKGISPETSSNVANLTQDGEGNYVFYHTSPTTLETIEPNKYGTNPRNVTSAEEKTAIGRVGGVSMYYPAENVAESIVSGNTHMVKIPESEVYDFNADPLNLIEEARSKFEKEFPGQAFTPNDQFAQVTKLAGDRGFKMVVGEWKDTTRAQTTEPLKPVDVKEKNGSVITKPFKEDFVSNKDKGLKSVIPETKEDKLKKVYEEIYDFKNDKKEYKDVYHLKEDYTKLSQEEITKMIEESNLPQEYKDRYNEALKYEPGQRRTVSIVGESVEVENAPEGNHLNIGLLEGRTDKLMSADDVLSKLPKDVKVISHSEIQGTEPSISVEISRPLTNIEMTKFLEDTKQQAIAQLSDKKGVLYDTKRGTSEGWGEFNPEYFVTQDGKNLTQFKPTEPTKKYSEKAKELADKVRNSDLPDWAKANIEGGKKQGVDAGTMKEALAKAIEKTGELMDKGIEFAEAVKEAINDIVNLLGEDKRASIEKDFADYYQSTQKPLEMEAKGLDVISKGVANMDDFFNEMSKDEDFNSLTEEEKKDLYYNSVSKYSTSQAIDQAAQAPKLIDLKDQSWLKKFIQAFQNKMIRVKDVQEQMEKALGIKILKEANVALKFELLVGKTINIIEDKQKEIFDKSNKDSWANRAKKDGVDIDQLGTYMYALHAEERNLANATEREENFKKEVDALNEKIKNAETQSLKTRYENELKKLISGQGKVKLLKEAGSGMTNEQAQEIIDNVEKSGKKELFDKYAKEFREKVIKPALDDKLKYGLIDQDLYDKLQTQYKNYVPLQVVEKAMKKRAGGAGAGASVKGRDIFKAKGSDLYKYTDRYNPIFSSMFEYQNTVARGERNQAAQALINLAELDKNNEVFEVHKPKYTAILDSNGDIKYMLPTTSQKLINDSVELKVDGKPVYVEIKDKAMRDALQSQGIQRGIRGLYVINSWIRSTATLMNPNFLITNFLRDYQSALINIQSEIKDLDIKNITGKIANPKNLKSAGQGIIQDSKGNYDSEWAKLAKEYRDSGGKVSWFQKETLEEYVDSLRKDIEKINKGEKMYTAALNKLGNTLMLAQSVVEQSVRLSTFKALKDAGVSTEEAARAAKNITVNFENKGTWGGLMDSLYLFATAGLSGTVRMATSLSKSKTARTIAGGMFAYGILEAALNSHLGGDDDDDEKIDDGIKERNFVLVNPKDSKQEPLLLPMAYGLNVFKYAGNLTYDVATGRKDATEATSKMFMTIYNQISPLQGPTLSQAVAPTAFDPFVQQSENKNFFGAPIKPEQPKFGPKKKESDLYFESVRPGSLWTAKKLNEWTGGNAMEKGYVDISPEILDHYYDALGGGTGKFISDVGYTGKTAAKEVVESIHGKEMKDKDEFSLRRLPFVKAFFGSKPEKKQLQYIYETFERSAIDQLSKEEVTKFTKQLKEAVKSQALERQDAKQMYNAVMEGQYKIKKYKGVQEVRPADMTKKEYIKFIKGAN
jgi:hypothetical protein